MIWDQCGADNWMKPYVCDLSALQDTLCLCRIDGNLIGILMEVVILFYSFAALACAANHLCRSMETLCDHWGIPEDIGGATFMAFGGAVPEIVVSFLMTFKTISNGKLVQAWPSQESLQKYGQKAIELWHKREGYDRQGFEEAQDAMLGAGAITGSGLVAFLLIPALCAIASPGHLILKRLPLLRDITAYLAALLVLIVGINRGISTLTCAFWLAIYIFYLLLMACGRKTRDRVLKKSKKSIETRRKISVFRERAEFEIYQQSIHHTTTRGLSHGALCHPPPDFEDNDADENSERENCLDNEKLKIYPIGSKSFKVDSQSTFGLIETNLNSTITSGTVAANMNLDRDKNPVNDKCNTMQSRDENIGLSIEAEASKLKKVKFTLTKFTNVFFLPVSWPINKSCPDCSIFSPNEKWWPVTLAVSFIWVSIFSFLLSSVICRWIDMIGVTYAKPFFGISLISLGAEIPDAINAITVANRGYGSMAASACMGSQIMNLCLGLGGPWFMAIALGKDIEVKSNFMAYASFILSFSILGVTSSTLGMAVLEKKPKAQITKKQAFCMIIVYISILLLLGILTFTKVFDASSPYHTPGNPKYVTSPAGWLECYNEGHCRNKPSLQ